MLRKYLQDEWTGNVQTCTQPWVLSPLISHIAHPVLNTLVWFPLLLGQQASPIWLLRTSQTSSGT